MDDIFTGFTEDISDGVSSDGIRASIDIGTNTVLLLVANIRNGLIEVLHEDERMPRLGNGVDQHRNLSVDSMERVIGVLIEYRNYIYDRFGVIPVVVTGTSAVRDAENRIEFLWLVEEATGYRVRILSQREETGITFKGALSVLDPRVSSFIQTETRRNATDADFMVIDIGGGSTEVAIGGNDGDLSFGYSFNMGSVRFSERYLKESPPRDENLDIAVQAINEMVGQAPFSKFIGNQTIAVGVAGTAITLQYLVQSIVRGTKFVDEAPKGQFIQLREIEEVYQKLRNLTTAEIRAINPGLMEGREDIILAGTLILISILKHAGIDRFAVSTGGIRHGALLSLAY